MLRIWYLGLGACLIVTAISGDLFESVLKRAAGVDDSGTFFPGHGGMLDRLDSLVFGFPAAYIYYTLTME